MPKSVDKIYINSKEGKIKFFVGNLTAVNGSNGNINKIDYLFII